MSAEQTTKPGNGETKRYVPERKRRAPRRTKLQPPLTPMIDVTFQLLLYFLLTSTFRPDEGQIPGTLPARGAGAVAKDNPLPRVRIVLRPRGADRRQVQYEVDRITVDREEELYRVLLGRRKVVTAEAPVEIRPDAYVRWDYVVAAFNAAVRAKFKNIGFATAY